MKRWVLGLAVGGGGRSVGKQGERSEPRTSAASWPLSEAGDGRPGPGVHGSLRPDRPAPGFRLEARRQSDSPAGRSRADPLR